ncbi:riboflavin synthase [Flavilitoribacter nigricans]|uniref:Riboflavin synthase n=1 Tax=Flavilitoribacter nigricans (strain ATCC 23147 / DSM 23189 / NBRC 102662 / NCIMB 1420 / SS-2) TaxID=1122177 RepID=A0A2D0N0Z3_FLAN2|nr:riboflavin synthase [Flavilitoribacter nigricans]PHN02036.1 riboflavin synthase [Flavilitoribacter nigricans DSM 23189 = NBRC 102662]
MFTGIIEQLGTVKEIRREGSNVHFTIASELAGSLKIDQSLSHNGVCLTVVDIRDGAYTVTAIEETLNRSNLGALKVGDKVNLERAMVYGGRLDGHIVQGHVDDTAVCTRIEEVEGSWYFQFRYRPTPEHLLVDKGSICVNGVSLTIVNPEEDLFSVAIIPYTYEHTNFQQFTVGSKVNLEFDVLGKYLARYAALYMK